MQGCQDNYYINKYRKNGHCSLSYLINGRLHLSLSASQFTRTTPSLCILTLFAAVRVDTRSTYLPRGFRCIQSISWSLGVDLAENWQQECRCLPRTCAQNMAKSAAWFWFSILRHRSLRQYVIPVCAQAMRSRLDLTIGMAYFWTGVGRV